MQQFINNLAQSANILASSYGLNIKIFLTIYLISFLPFYLGYFLIIYSTTRNFSFSSIYFFNLKTQLNWNNTIKNGVLIHMFGRLMPYVYILFWGKNLSYEVYLIVILCSLLSLYFFFNKIYKIKKQVIANISIQKIDSITENNDQLRLWDIYQKTFEPINRITPCRQSLDRDHFIEILVNDKVKKYILITNHEKKIGIGLITNDLSNTSWISGDYFKENYHDEYMKSLVYYFMGLAIDKEYRGNRYSIKLIEYIIDDLPKGAIMGFDHSRNVNPMLHHFTRIVKQARMIERSKIDSQHYHVVQRKN